MGTTIKAPKCECLSLIVLMCVGVVSLMVLSIIAHTNAEHERVTIMEICTKHNMSETQIANVPICVGEDGQIYDPYGLK